MKTFRLVVTVASVFVVVTGAFAQTKLTADPVFQQNCSKCHGKDGDGRFMGGPSLIADKATGMSADDLNKTITEGKGRMPKYGGKLTPEQINTLVQEIKAAGKK